jgi:hypothetical protein
VALSLALYSSASVTFAHQSQQLLLRRHLRQNAHKKSRRQKCSSINT